MSHYVDPVIVAAKLGLGSDIATIAEIEVALDSAKAYIDAYCGTTFVNIGRKVELYDGTGTAVLPLNNLCREIYKVELCDNDGFVLYQVTDARLAPNPPTRRDGSGNYLYSLLQRFPINSKVNDFPAGSGNVRIDALWGMETPAPDVKEATIRTVQHFFNLRSLDETVREMFIAGRSTKYRDDVDYLPTSAKRLLRKYLPDGYF